MSTRSNIYLKLRDEDKNKSFRSVCGIDVNPNGKDFLRVYCHHDGYPDGVGLTLVGMDMTYEDALSYILEGDRSDAGRNGSYWRFRREEVPPKPTDEFSCRQEYAYLLEEIETGKPLNVSCININGPLEIK